MQPGVQVDGNLQELTKHGDFFFPLEIHMDDLDDFPNHMMNCHWHEQVEFNYVLSGTVEFQVSGQQYIVRSGEMLFINSNCLHQAKPYSMEHCVFFCVVFTASMLCGFPNSIVSQKYIDPLLRRHDLPAVYFAKSAPNNRSCCQKILDIFDIYQAKPHFYEFEIQILLQSVWLDLLRSISSRITPVAQSKKFDEARLKTLLAFIESHYASKLTLEQIAASANISKSECCRFFKQALNRSPIQVLIDYRLTQSLDLLKNSNMTIADIATHVGFDSSSYFTKMFKRNFACSPTKYRIQNRP